MSGRIGSVCRIFSTASCIRSSLSWNARPVSGRTIRQRTKFDKLGTLLGGSCQASDDVRLVAGLLGVAPSNPDPSAIVNPRRQRERLLEALLRRVETLAQARPVLAVLEDVHWADPTTCELLDLLIARIASLPALLVLTHRPTFQAPWVGEAHVTELRLSRLNQRQCAALIGHIAGDSHLPPETVAAIIERADGVPLFLEELTKAVLERTAHGAALSPRADIGSAGHIAIFAVGAA